MKTRQLYRALKFHKDVKPIFKGVFASNRLPRYIPKGKTVALIANTDPSHKPGQHWVAFFYTRTHVYFFDSYGRPPCKPPFHRLMKYRKYKKYFGRRIQGEGHGCGLYCMYFILAMINNYDFTCFGHNLNANDHYVRNFVRENFPHF